MHLSGPLSPGGSTWQPCLTSEACTAQLPGRRSWPWPGTWSCPKAGRCRLLGTTLSSPTSPCLARPSALASLWCWAACLSPGWPGPAWPVCPCVLGPRCRGGPGPSAERLPALCLGVSNLLLMPSAPRLRAWDTEPCLAGPLVFILPFPKFPYRRTQRPAGAETSQGHRTVPGSSLSVVQGGGGDGGGHGGGGCSGRLDRNIPAPLPLTSRSGPDPMY